MNTTEKISVIIPTYNRANLIERSVQSVLEQIYDNLEVIVVDDGSVDNTMEVVSAFRDNRIVYHKLPINQGVSNARNVGAAIATASLIAFQDSDDCWRKDKLKKQMEYWGEYQECSMIYSSYLSHLANEVIRKIPSETTQGKFEGDIFVDLLQRNTVGAPTMLMKKKCFQTCGGFDITWKSLEDWEFVLRFAKNYRIGFVEEPLVDVFLLQNGISSVAGAYYESRCRMIAKYKNEMTEKGIFEQVVTELLNRASEGNILETVQKMLMIFLANSY